MNVFDLFASLSLDDSAFNEGLDNAEKKAGGFGKALGTGLKVGGAAVAAVGAGVAAMTGAVIHGAGEVAEYGDNIDKMSQKLGLSAEAYQEWDYVLGQAGTDIQSMSTGLKTLTNKIDDAKNGGSDAQAMFEKLGISLDELNSMSREDVFAATISGFQQMADSTERAALANDLFGRSGQELTPLFNSTIEDTEKLRKASHDLGFILSDEAVGAAADYSDALDTMQRTMNGVKRNMMGSFMPGITTVMDGLTQVFGGDKSQGIAMINEGLESVVEKIGEIMPDIIENGASIVVTIANAIADNLDVLLPAAANAVLTIAQGLIEHLPEIIETGLDVIVSLAQGIAEALPTLIPAIVDVIIKIVDILTDPENIGMMVDAAIAIIVALAEGLIEALPRLVEKIPDIIISLVQAIIENLPKIIVAAGKIIWALIKGIGESLYHLGESAWAIIKEIGAAIVDKAKDLWNKAKEIVDQVGEGIAHWAMDLYEKGKAIVDGVWEGISSKFQEFKDKVTNFFGGIVNSVKEFLGIASPSKVFAGIGDMMAAGLEKGFDDGMDDAEKSMMQSVNGVVDALSNNALGFGNIDFASSGLGRSSAAMINSMNTPQSLGNMTVQVVLPDGTEVARAWLPDFIKAASAAGTPLLA